VAAAVYSKRFGIAHDLMIGAELTYTVPVGFVAVLRDIDAYSGILTGNTLLGYLAATPDVVFFQASWGINETGWRSWRGRQVFYAGDTFGLSSNQFVDGAMSGYLLSAP